VKSFMPHQTLDDGFFSDMAALGEDVVRKVQYLTPSLLVLTLESPSALVVLLYNVDSPMSAMSCYNDFLTSSTGRSGWAHVEVNCVVFARSAVVRDSSGLVKDSKELSTSYNEIAKLRNTTMSSGFRYPAKWSAYKTSACVEAGEGRLLLIVTRSGVQYSAQDLQITCKSQLVPASAASSDVETPASKTALFMDSWASGQEPRACDNTPPSKVRRRTKLRTPNARSIFNPICTDSSLRRDLISEAAVAKRVSSGEDAPDSLRDANRVDFDTQAAIELSLLSNSEGVTDSSTIEDRDYQAAIKASLSASRDVEGGRDIICLSDESPQPCSHEQLVDLTALSQE